jgi:hypothetical protein
LGVSTRRWYTCAVAPIGKWLRTSARSLRPWEIATIVGLLTVASVLLDRLVFR